MKQEQAVGYIKIDSESNSMSIGITQNIVYISLFKCYKRLYRYNKDYFVRKFALLHYNML